MYFLCFFRPVPYLTNRLPAVVLINQVHSLYGRHKVVTCFLVVQYICSSTVASVLLIVRLPAIAPNKGIDELNRKTTGTGSQPHFLQLGAPAQSISATRVILLCFLLLKLVPSPMFVLPGHSREVTDHHVRHDRNSLLSASCHYERLHTNTACNPLAHKHLLRINCGCSRTLYYQHFHSIFKPTHHRIGLHHLRTLHHMHAAYPLTARNSRTSTPPRRNNNAVFLQGKQKNEQELFPAFDHCAAHRRGRAVSLAGKGPRYVRPMSWCKKWPPVGVCIRVSELGPSYPEGARREERSRCANRKVRL
jgi:hypothetical protein